MAVIDEVIRMESDGSVSFGDYESQEKRKVDDFEVNGNLYKVKTHRKITRLEKNGSLLLEAVPGAVVHHLLVDEKMTSFSVESFKDVEITMEMEPETEYSIQVGDGEAGRVVSNLSGKISFSIEIDTAPQTVAIEKM